MATPHWATGSRPLRPSIGVVCGIDADTGHGGGSRRWESDIPGEKPDERAETPHWGRCRHASDLTPAAIEATSLDHRAADSADWMPVPIESWRVRNKAVS